jgi:hypothetical protein
MFGQQSVAEAAAQAKAKSLALSPNAPTHDQVMTMLDLLRIRNTLTLLMDGMRKAAKEGAEQSFRERFPNPTPAQLKTLHGVIDDAMGDMPLDEMIEAMVPIYQRHLTRTDIEEIIRFYSSPVGQKLLNEQPQMVQEGMQAGMDIQKKRMGIIMGRIRERIDKMNDEDSGTSAAPKP